MRAGPSGRLKQLCVFVNQSPNTIINLISIKLDASRRMPCTRRTFLPSFLSLSLSLCSAISVESGRNELGFQRTNNHPPFPLAFKVLPLKAPVKCFGAKSLIKLLKSLSRSSTMLVANNIWPVRPFIRLYDDNFFRFFFLNKSKSYVCLIAKEKKRIAIKFDCN